MRSIRLPWRGLRTAFVALFGVATLLAMTVAPVTIGAAHTAPLAATAHLALPATTAHGAGFQVHTVLDQSFCIEVGPGTTDLRPVTLSLCNPVSAQRWTFTWLATGLNEMIDIQGMCLDVSGRSPGDGLALRVTFCHEDKSERLTFTPAGQIKFAKGCLAIPAASAGVAVILEACNVTHTKQLWKLSQ